MCWLLSPELHQGALLPSPQCTRFLARWGTHICGSASAPVAHARALRGAPCNKRQRAAVVCGGRHQLQVVDLVHAALDERHHKLRQLWQRWHVYLWATLCNGHLSGLCTCKARVPSTILSCAAEDLDLTDMPSVCAKSDRLHCIDVQSAFSLRACSSRHRAGCCALCVAGAPRCLLQLVCCSLTHNRQRQAAVVQGHLLTQEGGQEVAVPEEALLSAAGEGAIFLAALLLQLSCALLC